MDGELDWGSILTGVAIWLVTSTIGATVANVRKVPIRGFVAAHWQVLVAWGLFLIVGGVVYPLMGAPWTAIFALTVAAIVLSARYEYTVTKFSGKTGGFSGNRDGPYDNPVECKPLYHAWKPIEGAKWIWIKQKPSDQEAQRGQTVWHRLEFWLLRSSRGVATATLTVMVDDRANVYLNEQLVAEEIQFSHVPTTVHFQPFLRSGKNVIHMEITNDKGKEDATGQENPAGIVYVLRIA